MELSKRTLRQVKNMSKNFDFDVEKRVCTIPLHYETPEELLDIHLSTPGKPVISDDAIDSFCDMISYIPKEFKVKFNLTVDDYGEYDHKSLTDALKATVEDTYYYHDESRKKDSVLAVLFLIIGVLFLSFEIVGGMAGWYGEKGSITNSIIETVLDVMVWVFIWEGAYIVFLTYANDSTVFTQNIQRLCGLHFFNDSGEKLSGMNSEQLFGGWVYLTGKEILARNYILYSNAALLAVLSVLTVELWADIVVLPVVQLIIFTISWVLTVALVLSNISFYKESGRMRKCAPALSVVCFLYTVASLIYSLIPGSALSANLLWDIILSLVLLLNVVSLCYMRRQNVKIH